MWRACFVIALAVAGCSADAEVSRELGARCEARSECDDRCLAPSAAFPDGFCTLSCVGDLDCPGDATCVAREAGVCVFRCSVDAECAFLGATWRCVEEPRANNPAQLVKACVGS